MVYIGFGANLGDRVRTFEEAARLLGKLPQTALRGQSRLYETEPKGLSDDGPRFLNAVIALDTNLSPGNLIEAMRGLERELGKSPTHSSDLSRLIDLDLLLYGDESIDEDGLFVPHPRMSARGFVLIPLNELAPLVKPPGLNATVSDLLRALPESEISEVRVFEP